MRGGRGREGRGVEGGREGGGPPEKNSWIHPPLPNEVGSSSGSHLEKEERLPWRGIPVYYIV